MSVIYRNRLLDVQESYDAAYAALSYVTENWHRQMVSGDIAFSRQQIQDARETLETAYFLLLSAEFESILRDHLATNHRAVKFPVRKADWKVDWFLSRVIQREKLTIPVELRRKLDENRDYRNSLAHGNEADIEITLAEAIKAYFAFVSRLPEPFG